jgi:hypothetical protein
MLSDHWPIVLSVVLEQTTPSQVRKSTYFKYDASYLKNVELLSKVKEAWGTPDLHSNPLDSWEAAWRRILPIMKNEKARRREQILALADHQQELSHLRAIITYDNLEEEQRYLSTLEHKVRTAECQAAVICRTRSRIKWLSLGKAPSCYFFKQF